MNIRRLPPQLVTLAFGCVVIAPRISEAQNWRVMQLESQDWVDAALPFDRGIADLHRRLLELRTTASVMQTTAHPDDEQSGLLTYFARGVGARTSLLTLNRGEAGANAIGSELFDALGLVRTEELLLAGRYYGLSDQYFTSAADYGYSKTVREAARSWDTTVVIGDMVHAIRTNQPLVVISRWFGTERDGHGQHSMAGALTPLAVAAAADPSRYPEQIRNEGLRPWRVLRLFRSNLPASDGADVVIDPARYDPWLGESYQALGANGLSRQRSQTSGQPSNNDAPAPQRLQLMHGTRVASDSDLFSGLDTSLPGVFAVVGETEPKGARATLRRADDATRRAIASLD
ncbi:MAG: PIG-L family deacetylase, partial [Gemmatimonadaceae bacterium]